MDSKLIDTLNDLIRINRERAAGYQKLTDQLKPTDIDLKTLFTNVVHTSLQYVEELVAEVKALGGEPAGETPESGRLNRLWADIKAKPGSYNRRSILVLCEFGDDMILRAYEAAMESQLSAEVRNLLTDHKEEIQRSHHVVKRYRELQDALK